MWNDIRSAISNFFDPGYRGHCKRVARASRDPDFMFDMIDGCTEIYISKKSGCVVFIDPRASMLSPHNLMCILRHLERHPEAKAYLEDMMIPYLHDDVAPRSMKEAQEGKSWTQLLAETKAGTREPFDKE